MQVRNYVYWLTDGDRYDWHRIELPELLKEAVPRGRKRGSTSKVKWPDWETALSGVTNHAVVLYFKQELAANQESYLPKRVLRYRVGGKRRWFMAARQKNAYVWQHAQFENDIEFWRCGLSKPDDVKPVKDGECLRLFLTTADDFEFFHEAATEKLKSTVWLDSLPEEELSDVEADPKE